ncbi:MAG: pseudouridine synthase, partial [Pseudomonadota bacterium]|nr:pseudouridine synthase [Pseudomonadota bacterium]
MNQAPITILYQDQDVLAVEKPPGLLTVPGRGPDNQDCLIHRLLASHPNSRIVHRLDMATSGIVLIPQNHDSLSELSRQFQQRTIKKRYQAIVDGIVEEDSGVIDLPLICDWPNRPKQKVCHEQGKPSRTEFHVLQRNLS